MRFQAAQLAPSPPPPPSPSHDLQARMASVLPCREAAKEGNRPGSPAGAERRFDRILDRGRLVAEVDANPKFDVLIVGGGIAGAATFRDLALQGLRCLLIERHDFASGASGALTRVAQGGFRYLEKGELGLVARAVAERNLFVAAPPARSGRSDDHFEETNRLRIGDQFDVRDPPELRNEAEDDPGLATRRPGRPE